MVRGRETKVDSKSTESGRRSSALMHVVASAAAITLLILASAPVRSQGAAETPPPPPPTTIPSEPTVSPEIIPPAHQAERDTHSGLSEPGPGGAHAPQGAVHEQGETGAAADTHPPDAEHAEDAHGAEDGHAEEGHGEGEHKEEGVSIHLPTWIYTPLLYLWTQGPASLTASGALDREGNPIPPDQLVGTQIPGYKFHPHGSQRTFNIRPTIKEIGTVTSAGSAPVQEIELDSQQVTLIDPQVKLAWEAMFPEAIVVSWIILLCIMAVTAWLVKHLKVLPNRKQALVEQIHEFLDNNIGDLIGPGYRRYLPIISAAFIYIFAMNLAGIIPGWASPTANINVASGMALVVFLYVQYEGIRVNGFVGYLKHFVGEPIWMAPLNVMIHVIGELARLLSLSIRLFGNIFGEDVVIVILMYLAALFTKGFIPFQWPMYLLAIFTSLVQALVFAILTSVYLALATEHHHEAEHHGEGHGDHASGETPIPTAGAAAHA